jgi:hypothetical protein
VSARPAHDVAEHGREPAALARRAPIEHVDPRRFGLLARRAHEHLAPARNRSHPRSISLIGIEGSAAAEETTRPVGRQPIRWPHRDRIANIAPSVRERSFLGGTQAERGLTKPCVDGMREARLALVQRGHGRSTRPRGEASTPRIVPNGDNPAERHDRRMITFPGCRSSATVPRVPSLSPARGSGPAVEPSTCPPARRGATTRRRRSGSHR